MPKLLANQRLPLKRFWIPFTDPERAHGIPGIRLHNGVLPDPDDEYGRFSNPGLKTLSDIQQKRCFALLGQPGLGKTIAVEQWIEELRSQAKAADAIIYLTGRTLAAPEEIRCDTIESTEWRRAREDHGEITLVLDGLDEALQRLPLLVTTLHKCLKNEPPDRTRVVLVSRVADWRDSRSEELFSLWSETEQGGAFELCPLRWPDVRLAAQETGLTVDKFEKTVLERRVAWMAARPKLLLMLLEEFRKFHRLPDSRRELFLRAAMRMCEEHDPERHEVLERSQRAVFPADELMPIVARISAALILSGKSYVLRDADQDAKPSDLYLSEIIGGVEPVNGGTLSVDKSRILAALDTAHFVACGPARFGVDHQQMAEFMAAQYLSRCTSRQLQNLLMQRIDGQGYLSPQFRELSAWIAVQHPEFRTEVTLSEPRLLLEADSVELDDSTRAAAIAGVLAQLDSGETSDMYLGATFGAELRHTGLAKQLREYITNSSHNVVARRSAIYMARTAHCTSLKGDLWRLVTSSPQISVLHAAVATLARMATATDRPRFENILHHTTDEELKGLALRFLVPKYLSVSSVMKFLTPRNENLFGVYYNALHEYLPDSVGPTDVVRILNEYENMRKRGALTGPIRPIVVAAVKLALRHYADVRVRNACLRFLSTELQAFGWEGTWESSRPKEMSAMRERQWRRTLIDGFVRQARGRYFSFLKFNLWPAPEDLPWVLEKIRTSKGQMLSVWSHLAARMLFQGVPSNAVGDITRTYYAVRAFRQKLPTPRRFGLEETLTRRAQAVERRRELWRRRAERRKLQEARGQLSINEAIEKFRTKQLGWWPTFVRVVKRLRREQKGDQSREFDIAKSAAWRTLSASERRSAKKMARRFLIFGKMPPRKPGFLYTWDEAAIHAMVLLGAEIRRSSKLRRAIKRKWIPAIINDLYNAEPELEALSCLAYRLDPKACLRWASRELRRLGKQESGFYSLRRFRSCWNGNLSRLVSRLILKSSQPSLLARSFALLEEVAPDDGTELWRQCWRRSSTRARNSRLGILTFLSLFACPEVGWDVAMARIRKSSRAERIRIFAKYAHLLSYDFRDWSENLTDHRLGQLYELLVDLFPPDRLRDYTRGGSVRARDHLGDIERVCVNVLVQRASSTARAELRRLSETVADENRLAMKWRLREAIDQRLRTKWVSDQPTAADIIKMVRTTHALRVRDSGELRDAITCSLARLQSKMRIGDFPKLPEFWSEAEVQPKPEREIARVIGAWFQEDLSGDNGIVVDREPQVGFSGNMDIKVEIPANREASMPRLRVVIEIKRCTHKDITRACSTQLAEGYLRRKAITEGIYLVAWFDVPESQVNWSSRAAAEEQVHAWASHSSGSVVHIAGFVLDCRWKNMESPSSLARSA